jgi:hypothetical protein
LLDDRKFTLDNVNEAYAIVSGGTAKGKIVVDI